MSEGSCAGTSHAFWTVNAGCNHQTLPKNAKHGQNDLTSFKPLLGSPQAAFWLNSRLPLKQLQSTFGHEKLTEHLPVMHTNVCQPYSRT